MMIVSSAAGSPSVELSCDDGADGTAHTAVSSGRRSLRGPHSLASMALVILSNSSFPETSSPMASLSTGSV